MRLLAGLTVIAAFLLASTSARAQTSGVTNQSQRAQGCVAHLPLNADIEVTMKDGRKFKGKLIAARDSGCSFQKSVKPPSESAVIVRARGH